MKAISLLPCTLLLPGALLFPGALLLACGAAGGESTSDDFGRATTAMELLEDADTEAFESCRNSLEHCLDLPDAAPSEVCSELADHCAALEERLAEVRGPAMGCWRGVQACLEHAPPQAECHDTANRCDELDDDLDEHRGPVVECSEKVQACLVAVPEGGVYACDELAAACEHVGELAARAEEARAQGASNVEAMTEEVHDAVDGLPSAPTMNVPVDVPVPEADAGAPAGAGETPSLPSGAGNAGDAGIPVDVPVPGAL